MPDAKANHAKAQRKYAVKLRRQGAPRSDDLGRAMLAAARAGFAGNPSKGRRLAWELVVVATLEQLTERGFDRNESLKRLLRAVGRDPQQDTSEKR